MPTQKEVLQMATALHDKKLMNIDGSTRELLSVQLDALNGPQEVGWYVVGGTSYVLIGAQPGPDAARTPIEQIKRGGGK